MNVNSSAINNSIIIIKQINKSINHQSQPLHNKNMFYHHTIIHVYLFIRLLLIFLSCLVPCCAGSAVSLTLVLAVLVLVLVEAALDLKKKISQFAAFFTVIQQCPLRFLSFSQLPPLCRLIPQFIFLLA